MAHIKKCVLAVSLFALMLCSKTGSYAQKPFIRDYWLNEQYTAVNVQSLLQDKEGYIILGTDAGLLRFNGSDFSGIQSADEAVSALSLAGNHVFAGQRKGSISELSGTFNNKARNVLQRNGSRVRAIASNLKGDTLWIGTETGIIGFSAGRQFFKLDKAQGLSDDFVYHLCYLTGNRLLAATDNGINDVDLSGRKPHITIRTTADGLPDNIVETIKPVPNTGYYWLGMQQGGVALYNATDKTILNFRHTSPWHYGQISDILPLSETKAWIVTREGYLLDATMDEEFNLNIKAYSYPGHQFKKLICDRAGNLWCATKNGLSMITANYLSQVKLPATYQLQRTTALCRGTGDKLWLTQDSVLYEVRLRDTGSAMKPVFRPDALITCLHKDAYDRLWIGTMGKGLWYKQDNRFVQDKSLATLANSNILSITTIGDKLWISTLTGVDEIDVTAGERPVLALRKHHNKQSGIGSDYVYYLYPDHLNRLWMATDGAGVCMFDGKQYLHWSNPANQQTKVAYSITEDTHQNMWIGTYFKGLYHIKKGSNKFEMATGLTDANLSTVTANATGEVLAVYERCIDEWYPGSKQFRHFNFRMGLGIDSTSDALNCFTRDAEGNVFLPYEHGLLFFHNQYSHYDIRPAVALKGIATLSGRLPDAGNRFEYGDNYIFIQYDGICFTNAERLQYRYRLLGSGDKWIVTHDDAVTFSNLPPGTYTFQIQTTISGNYELANGVSYTFTIKAPFWTSIWFYIAVLLFIAVCVYGIIRMIAKRQEEQSLLQKERMEFEYEHLKSQVNPHFLFNSLNTLTNLIEEDQHAAVSYTEKLADLYQHILAYRSRDLISLKEELEILATYVYVQKCRFGAALQVQYSIPEELMTTRKVVPMVLQMLVENAIKHNVVSLSQPLKISIMSDDTILVVSNPLQPKMSKEKGAGIALLNIQKRYQLLTKKPVTFGMENGDYLVRLPLL